MPIATAIEIPSQSLPRFENGESNGQEAFSALLNQASAYTEKLRERPEEAGNALLGRVRGTGPGVSFGAYVYAIRRKFPVEMVSPFEGSHHVSGGVLLPECAGIQGRDDGFLFLRFDAGAQDLPMHTHDHSERLIYVLEGRGFFHVSDGSDGDNVRHVPVRGRDVLLFRRGTLHTFSTLTEPLLLLSYHAPFIDLHDPQQFTLPEKLVYPGQSARHSESKVACDSAWLRIA